MAFQTYKRVYRALWRNSVVREMSFKTNFLLWIVVELLWFLLQLTFVHAIYLHTGDINTWTKWEVIFLMSASHFIQQIFQAFFLVNCTNLSELIRTGKLDFMLLLPVNTRFLISLRQVDLGGFVNAASAVAVMVYACRELNFVPDFGRVVGFLVLCAAGVVIHYSLMFLLATISFWTVRAQGIVYGYYSLFNVARWPDAAFHGAFKAFFKFALPLLLVANVPVKFILHRMDSTFDLVFLFVMCGVVFLFSELFWRYSMRHYTSASS